MLYFCPYMHILCIYIYITCMPTQSNAQHILYQMCVFWEIYFVNSAKTFLYLPIHTQPFRRMVYFVLRSPRIKSVLLLCGSNSPLHKYIFWKYIKQFGTHKKIPYYSRVVVCVWMRVYVCTYARTRVASSVINIVLGKWGSVRKRFQMLFNIYMCGCGINKDSFFFGLHLYRQRFLMLYTNIYLNLLRSWTLYKYSMQKNQKHLLLLTFTVIQWQKYLRPLSGLEKQSKLFIKNLHTKKIEVFN